MNLNKIFIIGRLTQEPEARSTSSGQTVTTLRMATNRVWTDQGTGQKKEATEYHTVVAWGRLGEIASQYLRRGGLVMIEGRLQTNSWVGQDNVKRYSTEIVAENLQLGPRTNYEPGQAVSDINPPARAAKAASLERNPIGNSPMGEPEIPIINENEVTSRQSVEGAGEEAAVKEVDLPF